MKLSDLQTRANPSNVAKLFFIIIVSAAGACLLLWIFWAVSIEMIRGMGGIPVKLIIPAGS